MAKFRGEVKQCIQCGKEYKIPPSRAKSAKYCSPGCKYKSWMDSETKRGKSLKRNCKYCGKEFITFVSQDNIYCSEDCGHKSRRKRETRLCAYCGEPFETKRTAQDICCSWKCRVARSKTPDWPTWKKTLRECIECGKEFWVKTSDLKIRPGRNHGKLFCSIKCKGLAERVENATPPEFYTHTQWKEIRKEILERDDHRCRTCGFDGKGLHIHHIKYKRLGGSEDMSNLVTLCNPCHMKIHAFEKGGNA